MTCREARVGDPPYEVLGSSAEIHTLGANILRFFSSACAPVKRGRLRRKSAEAVTNRGCVSSSMGGFAEWNETDLRVFRHNCFSQVTSKSGAKPKHHLRLVSATESVPYGGLAGYAGSELITSA